MSIYFDKALILNTIKLHYGFKSDAEYARFLEIKPQTLASWYTRNTYDHELLYAKCLDINGDYILSGKEPMLRHADKTKNTIINGSHPVVITVDSHNNDNIVLVPQKLQAGYLQDYNNPKFIKDLPTYRMPGLNNGIFRMFEIEGNSMFPTLPNKSYVVGQFVEDWVNDIEDNQIYAIISNEVEGGIVKRCINRIEKYNNLICKSDNRRNFPTQNIEPSTIKEVWEIKLHLNFQLPDPADVYDRMNDLEADLQELKLHLTK